MADRCLEHHTLDGIARHGPDPGQAAHLEDCAACRSLVASYRTFLSDDPLPAGADPKAANARLDVFIDTLQDQKPAGTPDRGFVRSFLRGTGGGAAWRPALAALLVVAVGGLWWLSGDRDPTLQPSGVLRDAPVATGDFALTAAANPEGWSLAWSAAADADGYRVRVLDASLNEILLLDAGEDLTYRLDRPVHPELAAPGPYFASITAWKMGDRLRRTELVELTTGEP